MRSIGEIKDEAQAKRFGDFLLVQGMENEVEYDSDGSWTIWALDEDRLDEAQDWLNKFLANPNDPQIIEKARKAEEVRQKKEKELRDYRKRQMKAAQVMQGGFLGMGRVTSAIFIICAITAIGSNLGSNLDFFKAFLISEAPKAVGLVEIKHGQIWRLVTPAFLNFGFLHVLFNLLWWKDLGTLVERKHGKYYLLAMFLVIAISSNVGQYFVAGPRFGGMSGVVYGMLGYLWFRGKFDPTFGLELNPMVIQMMMLWFILCFTGAFGPIANTAHAVGLGVGALWGYTAAMISIRK
jgi:GlpG protein